MRDICVSKMLNMNFRLRKARVALCAAKGVAEVCVCVGSWLSGLSHHLNNSYKCSPESCLKFQSCTHHTHKPKISIFHTPTELAQFSLQVAFNKDFNPDKDLVYLQVTYPKKNDLIGPYLITDHGLDAAQEASSQTLQTKHRRNER